MEEPPNKKQKITKSDDPNHVFNLKGKVAIVTGGLGGIGLAISTKLAEAGCKLLVTGSKKEEDVKEALSEVIKTPALDHNFTSISNMIQSLLNLFPTSIF